MSSNVLERWQVERMLKHVQRELHYFNSLTGRIQQKHFPQNDPMKMAGERVRIALTDLSTHLEQLLARGRKGRLQLARGALP